MNSDNRPKIGVGVIIIKDGKVLLTKRKGSHGAGMWGSVGGHVEFGENPSDAVKREAQEELGLSLQNVSFLCVCSFIIEDKHYLDIGFTADITDSNPRIQPDEKDRIETVGWFALDNVPSPLFPPVRMYLESLKTGKVYFEE